jgi:hypothetical protein
MQELRVLLPGKRPSSCSPAKPLLPDLADAPIELPQAAVVRGSSVVLVVAAEFGVEGGLLPMHGIVAMGLVPFGDPFEGPPHRNPVQYGQGWPIQILSGFFRARPITAPITEVLLPSAIMACASELPSVQVNFVSISVYGKQGE